MEFISIRDLRANTAQIWEKVANNEEVVITSYGKPTAFLVHIPAGYFEETLQGIRQAKQNLRDSINNRQNSQTDNFEQSRENFFRQHPAEQRQAAFERLQTAFAHINVAIDLDKEREERIMDIHERPL